MNKPLRRSLTMFTHLSPSGATTPAASDQWALLKELADRPDSSQRCLSQRLGLSVGKTHYLLKAMLDKGWVKMANFRRSDNKAAYAYLLTPGGLTEQLRLTHEILLRKQAEFEDLAVEIDALRQALYVGPLNGAQVPRQAGLDPGSIPQRPSPTGADSTDS